LGSSNSKTPRVGYLTVDVERCGRAASVILDGELDLGSSHLVGDVLLSLEAEPADPMVEGVVPGLLGLVGPARGVQPRRTGRP
jgi:hypothetical protein